MKKKILIIAAICCVAAAVFVTFQIIDNATYTPRYVFESEFPPEYFIDMDADIGDDVYLTIDRLLAEKENSKLIAEFEELKVYENDVIAYYMEQAMMYYHAIKVMEAERADLIRNIPLKGETEKLESLKKYIDGYKAGVKEFWNYSDTCYVVVKMKISPLICKRYDNEPDVKDIVKLLEELYPEKESREYKILSDITKDDIDILYMRAENMGLSFLEYRNTVLKDAHFESRCYTYVNSYFNDKVYKTKSTEKRENHSRRWIESQFDYFKLKAY